MNHAYSTEKTAEAYKEFLDSEDGRIFQEVVGEAFLKAISSSVCGGKYGTYVIPDSTKEPLWTTAESPESGSSQKSWIPTYAGITGKTKGETTKIQILDAGCGNGWLTNFLYQKLEKTNIIGCDAGEAIIQEAKKTWPGIDFLMADLNQPLPFPENNFDIITASMVLHDVDDETAVMTNIARALKHGGKIIVAIVNPYYGFPVGEWKRGIIGRLLNKKPRLKLARFYNQLAKEERPSFQWRPNLGSHFTPLSHHLKAAKNAGLVLSNLVDITSKADSQTYNLNYQIHRFPIILLLEFTKV